MLISTRRASDRAPHEACEASLSATTAAPSPQEAGREESFDVDPGTAVAGAIRLLTLAATEPLSSRMRERRARGIVRERSQQDLALMAFAIRRELDGLGGSWLPAADARSLLRLPVVSRGLALRTTMLDMASALSPAVQRALLLAEVRRVDVGGLVFGLRRLARWYLAEAEDLERSFPGLRCAFVAPAALSGAERIERLATLGETEARVRCRETLRSAWPRFRELFFEVLEEVRSAVRGTEMAHAVADLSPYMPQSLADLVTHEEIAIEIDGPARHDEPPPPISAVEVELDAACLSEVLADETDDADGIRLRALPRQSVIAGVSLASESTFYTGLTENVSEAGLFVATWERSPVGTRVRVCLDLLGRTIEADGVVRWLREPCDEASPGMGVAFEAVSPESKRWIAEFLRARPALLFEP